MTAGVWFENKSLPRRVGRALICAMSAVSKVFGGLSSAVRSTMSRTGAHLNEANARAAAASAEQNSAQISRSAADLFVAIKNFIPQVSSEARCPQSPAGVCRRAARAPPRAVRDNRGAVLARGNRWMVARGPVWGAVLRLMHISRARWRVVLPTTRPSHTGRLPGHTAPIREVRPNRAGGGAGGHVESRDGHGAILPHAPPRRGEEVSRRRAPAGHPWQAWRARLNYLPCVRRAWDPSQRLGMLCVFWGVVSAPR
jgi:hypothetical protein